MRSATYISLVLATSLIPSCPTVSMGESPLHLAVKDYRSRTDSIQALLATGIDPNLRNEKGKTALHLALKRGDNASVIAALLTAGAEPDIPCNAGRTPLHHLLYHGSSFMQESLSVLLCANADLEKHGPQNQTPLEFAAEHYARARLMRTLLETGAAWKTGRNTQYALHE